MDFKRGRKSFLTKLTRAVKQTIYMRENGVDSPYLFLYCGLVLLLSLLILLRNKKNASPNNPHRLLHLPHSTIY